MELLLLDLSSLSIFKLLKSQDCMASIKELEKKSQDAHDRLSCRQIPANYLTKPHVHAFSYPADSSSCSDRSPNIPGYLSDSGSSCQAPPGIPYGYQVVTYP